MMYLEVSEDEARQWPLLQEWFIQNRFAFKLQGHISDYDFDAGVMRVRPKRLPRANSEEVSITSLGQEQG